VGIKGRILVEETGVEVPGIIAKFLYVDPVIFSLIKKAKASVKLHEPLSLYSIEAKT
jgi:hypothetical protein